MLRLRRSLVNSTYTGKWSAAGTGGSAGIHSRRTQRRARVVAAPVEGDSLRPSAGVLGYGNAWTRWSPPTPAPSSARRDNATGGDGMPPAADQRPTFPAGSRQEWRDWLAANHDHSAGVWLVSFKMASGKPVLPPDVSAAWAAMASRPG